MNRLHRLDHLRALAAFMVITWHFASAWPNLPLNFPVLAIFKQGWTGVSFFCVISGFILTYIYFNRDFTIRDFLLNRVLRIVPLFLVIIYLTVYLTTWDASSMLATLLTGIAKNGLPSYAGPGWTVLIECQFYLIFPFLLFFTRKSGPKYLLGLLLTIILIRLTAWQATGSVELLSYYSIFGRIDQFLLGMIVGFSLLNKRIIFFLEKPLVSLTIFGLGSLLIIIFFWWFDAKGGLINFVGEPWPSKSAIWIFIPTIEAIAYAFILCGYLYLPSSQHISPFSAVFSYIGVISYSLYLMHSILLPSIYLIFQHFHIELTSFEQVLVFCAFVAMPCIIIVASLAYFFIERPFMQLRKRNKPVVVEPVHQPEVVTNLVKSV